MADPVKITIPGGRATSRFHGIALEVLCRVFPDGADEGFEEWKAFEKAGGWLTPGRALGGFIGGRLNNTVKMRAVYLAEHIRFVRDLAALRAENDALREHIASLESPALPGSDGGPHGL